MAKAATPKLAVAVSKAGGLGFLAAGYNSDNLEDLLEEAEKLLFETSTPDAKIKAETEFKSPKFLPIGVGFITWSASLEKALPCFSKYCPAAVWLFAPANGVKDLVPWANQIRKATASKIKIWVQVGCVADALEVVATIDPDVIVVQGVDAGGHALAQGASIVSLLPEISDNFESCAQITRDKLVWLRPGVSVTVGVYLLLWHLVRRVVF